MLAKFFRVNKNRTRDIIVMVLCVGVWGIVGCVGNATTPDNDHNTEYRKNNPGYYTGTDSERIEQALNFAVSNRMPLEITRRMPDAGGSRDFWLIDRAILLPANTELQIKDCTIKLSDRCRDNFIRSANCGMGISPIMPVAGIRIRGFGNAVLEGANLPRATGDSAKKLGEHTFGTDCDKISENPRGDWRNVGILLAEVNDFEIDNLQIKDYHCWAVSVEYCKNGKISNLDFASTGKKNISGREVTILNQDGIDLRRGCKDILIENITGYTGDDLVALTGIRSSAAASAGGLDSTMVSASFPRGSEDDIENITIRDIRGYCAGGHHIVRFLNASGVRIHHIVLEKLEDLSPADFHDLAAIKIGDANPNWGGVTPLGDTSDFTINKVRSNAKAAILIAGSLVNARITNIENLFSGGRLLQIESGEDYLKNVVFNGEEIKKR